jgi:hypothetical protein
MSTGNNTNHTTLQCITCDKEIERNSRDHDECMLVNKGDDLICQDCPWVCEVKCGECPVCEEEEEEEEEEELAGHLCAGASNPTTVIIYTMAGGGAHWWNYEVHYDARGVQEEVYINNINGCHYQRGQMLFYYEDLSDQFRLEDKDFEADKWHALVHYT